MVARIGTAPTKAQRAKLEPKEAGNSLGTMSVTNTTAKEFGR